jgi:hypothetical protein
MSSIEYQNGCFFSLELFQLYVEYRSGQSGATSTGKGSEYLNEFKLVLEEMLSDVKLNPN